MASVCEIQPGAFTVSKDYQRSLTRNWRVIMDAATSSHIAVTLYFQAQTSIVFGTAHPVDSTLFALDWNIQPEAEDSASWIVSISYSTPERSNPDPLLQDLEYNGEFSNEEELMEEDAQGTPCLNSAGDPFSEPLTRDDPRPTFTISRNEASPPEALQANYSRVTNSDTYRGLPPGTVRVAISWQSQRHEFYGVYYRVNYSFTVNPQGWDARVLDQGFNYIDDNDEKQQILINNAPASEPVLLDGAGGILADDAEPEYLDFRRYPRLPFSSVFSF